MPRIRPSGLVALLSPALRALPGVLRTESAGGVLLLVGTALALLLANSPWRIGYQHLRELHVGPAALDLDLSLHAWAADGLLTTFFFVVGLELKRESSPGSCNARRRRSPRSSPPSAAWWSRPRSTSRSI